MKTIKKRIKNLKLNQKLSLIVFGFALVPVVILAAVIFGNMQDVLIENRTDEILQDLAQIQTRTEKTVELCNMTSQVILNSPELREYLIQAKKGTHLSTYDLMEFYRNDIGSLEKMINANPYLYQVRVYFDNTKIPEIMPMLYHTKRMKKLSWSQRDWVSGEWQFEYVDTIFPPEVKKPVPHIMSLVTEIEDFELGRLGILEVAVRMDELMPNLYVEENEIHTAFVTNNGNNWNYGLEATKFWTLNNRALYDELKNSSGGSLPLKITIDNKSALLCAIPLEQLGGEYISVFFPEDVTEGLTERRNLFFFGTLLLLFLLAISVNYITKAILRRLYIVLDTVSHIQDGKLSERVPPVGDDEVGVLGDQVNLMLDKITTLMDENMKRQLLAKNSEIRALQSQINAHFIYNVLESIKMMAEVDGKYEISDAITSLGKLLRYSMRLSPVDVTITEELDNVENYINLFNLRFDRHIILRRTISHTAGKQTIPKLTLQPIVENAVTHGSTNAVNEAFVDVAVIEEKDSLYITVTDHGKGLSPDQVNALKKRLAEEMEESGGPGNGIGMKNVHDRLVMAYGPAYGIDIASVPDSFTRVTIHIPYTVSEVTHGHIINR